MERDRRPVYLCLLFAAADALTSAWYWPRLPDVMAQHFDGAGRPNGWASKISFFIFIWLLLAGMSALFFGLPKLLRKLPFALVNIPYKSYWEATPERQQQAWDLTERPMHWLGAATIMLLSFVLYLTIRANLDPAATLDDRALIAVMIAFGAFMLGWTAKFILGFKPPEAGAR